jgi:hypothetical protein
VGENVSAQMLSIGNGYREACSTLPILLPCSIYQCDMSIITPLRIVVAIFALLFVNSFRLSTLLRQTLI